MVFCNEEKKGCEVIKKLTNIFNNDSSFHSLSLHLNNLKDLSMSGVLIFFLEAQQYLIVNSYLKRLEKSPTNC